MNAPRTSPVVRYVTRRVSGLLGIDAQTRRAVVAGMILKPAGDGPTYWLELSLSAGIATLGLVLNSAGVIIGAMLIAPLMTPIVELAMGLVVTSSTLVVNALGRAVASVLFVVGTAALITTALPFHEPTPELLARTAPTVLDLVVAMFCAVAGAAVTARPSPAGASTAAGTAIGISLVPPLCACGFGVGTGDARIAEGALLLFVANFCAILTFAGLFFGLVGFGRTTIVAGAGKAEVASGGRIAHWKQALIRRLDWRLARPHGAALRLLIPVLLLVAVMVPLTRALRDVTYEVRARAAVRRLVQTEPLLAEALQMTTDVQRRTVRVSAVVVGSDAEGQGLEHRLQAALVASGAPGLVRVRAVPSAGILTQPGPAVPDVVPPIDLVSPGEAADKIAAAAIGSLRRRWPAAAGTVAAAHVEVEEGGSITVAATLVGPTVDPTARAVLAAAVGDDLGQPVAVRLQSLPAVAIDAAVADAEDWWARAGPYLPLSSGVPAVSACLTMPSERTVAPRAAARRVRQAVTAALGAHDPARVRVEDGETWSIRFIVGSCEQPAQQTSPSTASSPPR